jgi:large subunit ribosomal protein L4
MPKAKQYNLQGKELGEIDLPQGAFGAEPNEHVVWEAVKAYRSSQRQGTAATKGRSEVRGGGRKPWRQKGTGRARHGTIRSPIWKGGGIVFGPHPRDFAERLPRKARRLAMVSAMSQRAQEGNVAVVHDFSFQAPRTRTVVDFVKAVGLEGRTVCFITAAADASAVKSCHNIPGVEILNCSTMNVHDLVRAEVLIFTSEALEGMKEAYGS